MVYSGSKKGISLLRSRIMQHCKIPHSTEQDTILFADHGRATDLVHSRQFKDKKKFTDSFNSLKYLCKGTCKVVSASFSNINLCEQAKIYYRSRIVVAHHGANMANSIFLQPNSLVIEINQQCDKHIFSDSGYGLLHASIGISYIGARVAYMHHKWYDFRSTKLIYVNYSKWNVVLQKAREMLNEL